MEPMIVRERLLKPGTRISLGGDDCGPSIPIWKIPLEGSLKSYIVVERQRIPGTTLIWDTAVIMALDLPLIVDDYGGLELLLLHRHEPHDWNNWDPDVLVYGIKITECLEEGPLSYQQWEPKTTWLAGCPPMLVDDPKSPSLMSIHLKQKAKDLGE